MPRKKPMKKLVYWKAWFEGALRRFGNDPNLSHTYDFQYYMESFGFHRNTHGISRSVWINKGKRIVIKRPYLSSSGNKKFISTPRVAKALLAPTLIIKDGWLVQVFCRTDRADKAHKVISEKLKTWYHKDIHSGNVGHYRNKAVFFDW